ncbi:phosphoglycerate mutase family protein, partial [Patescibacteria group bacterium]
MKLLFIRHGESEDDLIKAYGGWGDFHLTTNGKAQIEITAEKINALNIPFDKILTSPLIRAQESAQIIATKLSIPIEIFEFV